jgi:glutathione S-transferase
MIELIQIPWSPFCIVQRRILEFAHVPFKVTNIPVNDRSLVWKLSRQRYYHVPLLRDGRNILFEAAEDTQVLAKYLDQKLQLGLFPHRLEGLQSILWRTIETQVEDLTFRLNDVYWSEFVPRSCRLGFVRHKERRYGRGCLEVWPRQQAALLADLTHALIPYEHMLLAHPFLIEDQPRFVDFDLYGMLGNFLFSGHYQLPAVHPRLQEWYERMSRL